MYCADRICIADVHLWCHSSSLLNTSPLEKYSHPRLFGQVLIRLQLLPHFGQKCGLLVVPRGARRRLLSEILTGKKFQTNSKQTIILEHNYSHTCYMLAKNAAFALCPDIRKFSQEKNPGILLNLSTTAYTQDGTNDQTTEAHKADRLRQIKKRTESQRQRQRQTQRQRQKDRDSGKERENREEKERGQEEGQEERNQDRKN